MSLVFYFFAATWGLAIICTGFASLMGWRDTSFETLALMTLLANTFLIAGKLA